MAYGLLTACMWVAQTLLAGLHVACLQLVYSLFTACLRIAYGLLTALYVACLWLPYGLLATCFYHFFNLFEKVLTIQDASLVSDNN